MYTEISIKGDFIWLAGRGIFHLFFPDPIWALEVAYTLYVFYVPYVRYGRYGSLTGLHGLAWPAAARAAASCLQGGSAVRAATIQVAATIPLVGPPEQH
jgi:hypothetical protein